MNVSRLFIVIISRFRRSNVMKMKNKNSMMQMDECVCLCLCLERKWIAHKAISSSMTGTDERTIWWRHSFALINDEYFLVFSFYLWIHWNNNKVNDFVWENENKINWEWENGMCEDEENVELCEIFFFLKVINAFMLV